MNDRNEMMGDAIDDCNEFLSNEETQQMLEDMWAEVDDGHEFDDWLQREEERLEDFRSNMGWEDTDFQGWFEAGM